MYLSAHHVIATRTGLEGVNAFLYSHGPYTWNGLPPAGIPDQDPGVLINAHISVPPPGNRVRSYLDVVAPDDTQASEIRQSFITFVSQVQLQPFSWVGLVGRCMFRIGMDQSLTNQWRREIAQLYRAVSAVRVAPGTR